MSLSNNFPTVSPTLNLNFAAAGRLDSRVTFTRSSTATYTNQIGLIQSAAVNEPRFDYDPVTLAARGLLVEEQRVNQATYSDDLTNAAWTKIGSSISANAGTAPDGMTNADKLVEDTANTNHTVFGVIITATTLTTSVYVKAAGRTNIIMRHYNADDDVVAVNFDLSAGVASKTFTAGATFSNFSYSITPVGNSWYRCTVTSTRSSGTTYSAIVDLSNTNNPTFRGGGDCSYTGDGSSGVLLWGFQVEAGSFATSYIPTVAASVTRSADVASVNTLSPWWNATESTIYSEFDTFSTNDAFPYALGVINTDEIDVYRIGSSGNVLTLMFASSSLQNNSTIATATSLNATIKAAYAVKANDLAGSANGGAAVTDTSATLPSVSTLYLGARSNGTGPLNGHLRRLAVYPRRLTNAQLQALTL